MNMTMPRQRYTAEFKAQAVELISTGKPVSQIAEDLCIGSNLLYKWKQDCAPCDAKTPSSNRRMTF